MYEDEEAAGYNVPNTALFAEQVHDAAATDSLNLAEELYYHHHLHQRQQQQQGDMLPTGEADASVAAPTTMELQLDDHMDLRGYAQLGQDPASNANPGPPVMFHQYDAGTSYDVGLTSDPTFPGPAGQDVISHLVNLPRCSASSLLLDQPPPDTPPSVSSVLYDPVFHLNLPPQPPFFRELLQSSSLPGPAPPFLPGSRGGGSLFGNVVGEEDHRDGLMMGCLFQEGPDHSAHKFDGGVFEFARDMACVGKGRRGGRKVTKHFTTERERRVNMNGRFDALRSLVPNPSKADRASTVADAIDYIKELLRTVDELKLLVEKKRRRNGRGGARNKRHKSEGDGKEDQESSGVKPETGDQDDPSYGNGAVRTSWLQRKSKDTEVDVRVVDDEVTIKLVWRKKINCLLLYVSKALDELQLDLHHVAGGHIGDHCCFLFNTKIYEGSSVYASAIANKLIAVVDGQFAATPATVGCY